MIILCLVFYGMFLFFAIGWGVKLLSGMAKQSRESLAERRIEGATFADILRVALRTGWLTFGLMLVFIPVMEWAWKLLRGGK